MFPGSASSGESNAREVLTLSPPASGFAGSRQTTQFQDFLLKYSASMKSPGLAAVLSFFICGLGQIYNGQILKGLVFLVAYFVSWAMMWIVVGFITT